MYASWAKFAKNCEVFVQMTIASVGWLDHNDLEWFVWRTS